MSRRSVLSPSLLLCLFLLAPALHAEDPGNEDPYARRRTQLQAHQLAGLTTWALWLATNLQGEKALKSMYRESDSFARLALLSHPEYSSDPLYAVALQTPDKNSIAATYFLAKDPAHNLPVYLAMQQHSEWEARTAGNTHRSLAYATMGMYALTAGLAFSAPKGPPVTGEDGISPIMVHKWMIPLHLLAMLSLPSLGQKIEEGGPAAAARMQRTGWAGFGALSIAMFSMTF